MVLQLVFDPLAYLQYSALPDHRPGLAAFYQSPGARHLVPGLVAEDHAEHHVHAGCRSVSASTAVSESADINVPEEVAIMVA